MDVNNNVITASSGTGWVPDNPDLRDRNLSSGDDGFGNNDIANARLKKEDSIEFFEEFASKIIETLQVFIKNSENSRQSQETKAVLDALQDNISGNIQFTTVKVRRQLDRSINAQIRNPKSKENLALIQRIYELKNCLYLLYKNEYLDLSEAYNDPEIQEAQANDETGEVLVERKYRGHLLSTYLDDIRNVMRWLRDPEFDLITVMLVRQFQFVSNIYVDGIVGLEAYTALENFIRDISNTKDGNHNQAVLDSFRKKRVLNSKDSYPLYPRKLYNQLVELVSVPSYLPSDILDAMFKKLELSAKTAIEKSNNERFLTIQKKIFPNSCIASYFQEAPIAEDKIIFLDKIKNSLSSNGNGEILREMFESEFMVLEPIASVILQIVSPVSQFDQPLSQIMADGFLIYEELLSLGRSKKWRETLQKRSPIHLIALKHDNDVSPDLAILALRKTWDLLHCELESLKHMKQNILEQIKSNPCSQLDENKEIRETKRKLYFYLLVEKFIEYHASTQNILPDILITEEEESDDEQENSEITAESFGAIQDFSKRESFELVIEPSVEKKAIDGNVDLPIDFITPPQIQVLLNSSFLNRLRPSSSLQHAASQDPSSQQFRSKRKFLFLPNLVDLSFWCSTVRDQGNLKSCAAFVGVALLEYFTHRYQDRYTEVSPLFLYKVTRNLMGTTDDVGSSLRATMRTMATFGVAPEEYWPYDETKVNVEPPAICYSLAEKYQALKYFRLDYAGISQEMLLFQIKAILAAGFPCGFGVTLYSSAYKPITLEQGLIPYPNVDVDKQIGGHAFVAVGYDNYRKIPHADPKKPLSQGAFLVRNSQGTEWGLKGYAWLPYDYVMEGLTGDWWSLLKAEWLKSTTLGLAASHDLAGGKPPTTKPG
jgi:C1A family cysteine protease